MTKSHVELDFLGLNNLNNSLAQPQSQPQPRPRLDRRQSFRGIAKMNPEIVKSVMASATNNASKSLSHPGSPQLGFSQLPVFRSHPFSGASSTDKAGEASPMTIFYNGTVSVFDLPHDKAESIMKFAMEKNVSKDEGEVVDHSCSNSTQTTTENILDPVNNDDGDDANMPITRKKSLQRFFEKRKERLIPVSPYKNLGHVASGRLQQKT